MEVAKLTSFPTGSEEGKLRLEELRRKGNYFHITNLLKSVTSIIIPERERRSKSTDAANLLPYPSCFGFYTKTKLSRHYNICVKKDDKTAKSMQRRGMGQCFYRSRQELQRSCVCVTHNVLSKINNDQITLVVRQDVLILKLASKLMTKHAQDRHLKIYIRSTLVKKLEKWHDFLWKYEKLPIQNLMQPHVLQKEIEAVRNVTSYNSQTGKYSIPSLALKIGHSLKK